MDEIERLKIYVDFYKDCLDRLLKMYPDPKAKEMYELGVKDGADLAWMHGSDATARELEIEYFKGMDEAMKKRNVQPIVHGKWHLRSDGKVICSCCGAVVMEVISEREEFAQEQAKDFKFCYNCGAKMDGAPYPHALTNGDSFRTADDYTLANFFQWCVECNDCPAHDRKNEFDNCLDCALAWLKTPLCGGGGGK